MQTQICKCCNEEKPLDQFRKCKTCKNGYGKLCSICHYARFQNSYIKGSEKYRNKNKDKVRDYAIGLHGRFAAWKKNASKRDIDWQLTIDDVSKYEMTCAYTKIPLTFEPNQYNTVSLERLDSNKGYTPENTVFCCKALNFIKLTTTLDEFIMLCEMVVANQKDIRLLTR